MKKIVLILGITLMIQSLLFAQDTGTNNSEGIQFFEGSWDAALTKAQSENKLIFLDVYAVWCAPCKALKKNTFPNAEVGEFFNEHYISVSLDGEKGVGKILAKNLQIQAYPSLFILDAQGNPLLYYPGYMRPNELLEFGKSGINQKEK